MIRLKITTAISLLTAASLLIGCASQPPIFNAHKLEEKQVNPNVEELAPCTNTYVEFISQEDDLFLFYVEVESNVEDTLEVYPTEIYLEVVEDIGGGEKQYIERYYALDPFAEVMAIDQLIIEEDERHETATATNVIFGVLNVFGDIASDREDKEVAVVEDVVETGINQANEEAYHSNAEEELKAGKEFWKNEVLNETTLEPDEIVGGLVYLPFSKSAKLFKVIVPVCDSPESNLFKQVQINK